MQHHTPSTAALPCTPLISTAELAANLATYWVFDVRHQLQDPSWGQRCYAQAHLPHAYFLHMDDDLSGPQTGRNGRHPLPEVGVFLKRLAATGLRADSHVVVYDQNNAMMASRLWWMLSKWLGHPKVSVLNGGWDAWIREGRPTQAEATPAPFTTDRRGDHAQAYRAQVQQTAYLDADQVLQQLHQVPLTQCIVDARAPERFAGSVEPLDPVAGHIPTARNYPFNRNLDSAGLFLEPQRLRLQWLEFLAATPVEQVVHQCGSGVSACHNLLAMEYAGLSGSRLYPGSWSEWCADAQRPMATGAADTD
jgi:thiosulfate/3-mercaptopyruvate sulfurtransferase